MREIKFKYYYKNKHTKEIISKIRDIETIEDTEFEIINLENEHLELLDRCQYTGLKDKNGKEIYEGDIVKGVFEFEYEIDEDLWKTARENIMGEVVFQFGCFGVLFEDDCFKSLYEAILSKIEVIGNIYENPELLEENND